MQRRKATGDPLEATEARSRAQIFARERESIPLLTLPGPLRLCLLGEIFIQVVKQVRTVPVRGCDAEKAFVLRSVI